MRRLIVFAGVLGLVMALNAGVAFAHDGGAGAPFAPIGSRVVSVDAPGHKAADNGFDRFHKENGDEISNADGGTNLLNPAIIGITHNPNCPLHDHA